MSSKPLETGEICPEGNTKQGKSRKMRNKKISKKQETQRKYWCFTYFYENRDLEIEKFKKILSSFCKVWLFGEEICPTTNRPHFQGYWHTNGKKGLRFTAIKEIFNEEPFNTIHFEPCKGSKAQNEKYCKKDKIYHQYPEPPPKIECLEVADLFPFQKSLLDIIKGPVNKNKIIWVYDPIGQTGKTEFLRYCFLNHNIPFSYGGKCSDIINLVFNNRENLLKQEKPCFIYNFGRDTEPDKISYKSMEQISDGTISNTKFEGACFVFNKPHVIVLANCLPITDKLTASRWIIKKVEDKHLIDYTEWTTERSSDCSALDI